MTGRHCHPFCQEQTGPWEALTGLPQHAWGRCLDPGLCQGAARPSQLAGSTCVHGARVCACAHGGGAETVCPDVRRWGGSGTSQRPGHLHLHQNCSPRLSCTRLRAQTGFERRNAPPLPGTDASGGRAWSRRRSEGGGRCRGSGRRLQWWPGTAMGPAGAEVPKEATECDQRPGPGCSQWGLWALLLGWSGRQHLPGPRRVGAEGLES